MDKSPDAFRTISEVADFLETPAHVLRFWESRFPQIKPVKRAGGRRYYRPGDVALLAGIRQLLHQDGMTIRGVQKILRDQGVRHVISLSDPNFSVASLSEDEAFGAMAEPIPEGIEPDETGAMETVSEEAEDGSNVVTLTDWRLGATPSAAIPDAADQPVPHLPEVEGGVEGDAQMAATDWPEANRPETNLPEADALAPEQYLPEQSAPAAISGGASLVAEPEGPAAIVPASEEEHTLPTPAPLQWSLFDTIPSDESVTVVEPLDDSVEPEPQVKAGPAEPAGYADPLEPVEVEPPQPNTAESHPMASGPEAPAPLATLTPAEQTSPAIADLPWLPPRLRALQAASDSAAHGDLAPLLARARALHARLRDAAQSRRG